jgi:hypothetical protein
MTSIAELPVQTRSMICEHCGRKIASRDIFLLRDSCALPEEPTFHVHGSCVESFIEAHPGRWNKIPRDSFDAGWLLY